MKASNIVGTNTVAIIGMPSSGTTITTSFVNSIDSSIVFGEPHRIKTEVTYHSEFGKFILKPGNTLSQITDIADRSSIRIRGFKEVWNAQFTDPLSLVDSYFPDIDVVLVVIREPRRNYAAMQWHRHNRGTEGAKKENIIDMYVRMTNRCLLDDMYLPIIYERFCSDPVSTINSATGWGLSGVFTRSQYVGGGHRSAMASEKIKANPRKPSMEKGLLPMVKAYETVVLAVSTLGCDPGSESANLSGLP